MSPVQLSICIATLNRASFLGETLESIISQATEEVEVVVVDGASTDNTQQVVEEAATRFKRLRYERLAKKGGVDQDYCRAAELASGKFIWLFTDDDLLKPGAIAAVLEATHRDYSLIIVNAEVRSKDLTLCLQPLRVQLSEDRVYSPERPDRDHLLADTGVYLSFIGGVVINRELWLQREKPKYFGTEFIHLGVIFQSPLPGKAMMMAFPWIVIRYGNAQWVSRSFRIGMLNWPNLVWSFHDFASWAKYKVAPSEPWSSYPELLFQRALGRLCLQDFESHLASRIKSPLRRFITRTIAVAPVWWVNFFARYYARWILRKNPSIGLYDLESWHQAHRKPWNRSLSS
jgi:abequosyltransferase